MEKLKLDSFNLALLTRMGVIKYGVVEELNRDCELYAPLNRLHIADIGVRAILTTKREALPIGPQSSSLCF